MTDTQSREQPTASEKPCCLGTARMSPREAAEFYLSEFGWLTVPCRITYVEGGKKTRGLPRNYPALKHGTISWDRIAKFWTSKSGRDGNAVAHVLRPGLLVVDLDGPSADKWLVGREFTSDVPCLKTGNGRHYLLRCPEDWDFDLLRFPVDSDDSKVECLVGRLEFVPPCPDGRIWLVPPGKGGVLPLLPRWLHDEIEQELRRRRQGGGDAKGPASKAASVPSRSTGKNRTPADFGGVLNAIEVREWRAFVPNLT